MGRTSSSLCAAAAMAVAAAAAAAAPTTALRSYAATTSLFTDPPAALHWTLAPPGARLGLVITDAAVINANASALWVGIGVGEPTSGGMLGADIATAEVNAGSPGGCRLIDRHVKSVAYPLGSAAGGKAVFPDADTCQDKDSWALVGCAVNVTAGTITLEVDRPLAAADVSQDRALANGSNVFLYAYGDGFGYHGARRRSVEVDLSATGAGALAGGDLASTGRLPPDADGSILLTMPAYPVSTNDTDYGCAAFSLPAPAAGNVTQVVAIEPAIDVATAGGRLVHHFVLSSCPKTPEFDSYAAGRSCNAQRLNCIETVWGWAIGAQPLIMPDVAGYSITDDNRHFLLQVHYDNPEGLAGVVDNTSVRLHTTTKRRQEEVGIIPLGDIANTLFGQTVNATTYTFTCPSACTAQMAAPVTVFASALHAHRTALTMHTNVYRNGSAFPLEGVAFWSNEHQRHTLFKPTTLHPGDRLTVSATYDTAKILAAGGPAPVWGRATADEMLKSGLLVHPRPVRVGPSAAPGDTISRCGAAADADGPLTWCGGRRAAALNGSAAIEGVDFWRGSAQAAGDPAGWTQAFGGNTTCAAGGAAPAR